MTRDLESLDGFQVTTEIYELSRRFICVQLFLSMLITKHVFNCASVFFKTNFMIIQKVLYYYSKGKARLYVRGFELEAERSLTQSSIGVHTYTHNKNWNSKL